MKFVNKDEISNLAYLEFNIPMVQPSGDTVVT